MLQTQRIKYAPVEQRNCFGNRIETMRHRFNESEAAAFGRTSLQHNGQIIEINQCSTSAA